MKVQVELSVETIISLLDEGVDKLDAKKKGALLKEVQEALATRGEAVVSGFMTQVSQQTAGATRQTKVGPVTDAWIRQPKKVAEKSGIPLIRVTAFRPTKGAVVILQAAGKLQAIRGQANTDLVVLEAKAPVKQVIDSLKGEAKTTKQGNRYLEITAREVALSAIASYRQGNGDTTTPQSAPQPAPQTAETVVNELGF